MLYKAQEILQQDPNVKGRGHPSAIRLMSCIPYCWPKGVQNHSTVWYLHKHTPSKISSSANSLTVTSWLIWRCSLYIILAIISSPIRARYFQKADTDCSRGNSCVLGAIYRLHHPLEIFLLPSTDAQGSWSASSRLNMMGKAVEMNPTVGDYTV